MRNLDPSSGLPLYLQVADVLREEIGAGELEVGDPVPSLRATASRLRVNVHTVGKAFQLLEREGLLNRRRGDCYRVAQAHDLATEIIEQDIEALLDRAASLNLSSEQLRGLLEAGLARREQRSA